MMEPKEIGIDSGKLIPEGGCPHYREEVSTALLQQLVARAYDRYPDATASVIGPDELASSTALEILEEWYEDAYEPEGD